MLAIPAFQARTQTALFRASNKPPLEVVVANLTNVITGVIYSGCYGGQEIRKSGAHMV